MKKGYFSKTGLVPLVFAGIASMVIPQNAQAQGVYTCTPAQHTALTRNASDLEDLARAVASSCAITSRHPQECVGPASVSANKQGLVSALNVLTSVVYDTAQGSVTLNFQLGDKTGFQSYPQISSANLEVLDSLAKEYCSQN